MDAGVVSGTLRAAPDPLPGDSSHRGPLNGRRPLDPRRQAPGSRERRLRRRLRAGHPSGYGGAGPSAASALLDDALASPSSRFLASDPTALVTPSHTLFQQPARAGLASPNAVRPAPTLLQQVEEQIDAAARPVVTQISDGFCALQN